MRNKVIFGVILLQGMLLLCVQGSPLWNSLGNRNGSIYTILCDSNDNVYVGCNIDFTVGGAMYIAKWNGAAWTNLGGGMNNEVRALAMDHEGNLYAGGEFTTAGGIAANYVAKWNGMAWTNLGSGTGGKIRALITDSSGNLYAGGVFTNAGGVAANNIAKWDGSIWTNLGSGMMNGTPPTATNNCWVRALIIDTNNQLYAAGTFSVAGGLTNINIAKWTGSIWTNLSTGMNADVFDLALDPQNHLYAAGDFTNVGGIVANRIACWDGSVWTNLGDGFGFWTRALAYDTNTDYLYIGGCFTNSGSWPRNYAARWNGLSWTNLDIGMDSYVLDMAVDARGNLFAGGWFTTAGGESNTVGIARWGESGAIRISPTTLTYSATYQSSNPVSQSILITNVGHYGFRYTNSVGFGSGASNWFGLVDSSGFVWIQRGNTHAGQVNISNLNAGIYSATCSITSGDATNSPQSFVVNLTVAKGAQTITFPMISNQVVTSTVQLSAAASSGLPVSFAVSGGPAIITNGTNLTFTGTGTASIVASQAGNANWNAAPSATNTFQVSIGPASAISLSDFMFLPRAIHLAAHPSNIKFTFKNNGPSDMSTTNTRILCEFYLSLDTNFSESTDLKIGEYGMDITLTAGLSSVVHLQNLMLDGIIIPTVVYGEYYVFLRVQHVSPSSLYDPDNKHVVMRNGTIKVGLGQDGALTLPIRNDFDGDGISDLALYQESTGNWGFLLSGSGYSQVETQFGGLGYRPILGDYDGDGKSDLTVYNETTGIWFIRLSGSGYQQVSGTLGGIGIIPIAGDYDYDGKTDPTVYQESTGGWRVLLSSQNYLPTDFELGGSGYQAISGDYDGDGKSDPTIYNVNSGQLKTMLSGNGYQITEAFLGGVGYQAVPGDYDWDGKTDPAFYNETTGEWIVWLSAGNYTPASTVFGGIGRAAVQDDYDGDGKVDPAYYEASSGIWVVLLSGQGYQSISAQWGAPGYEAVGTAQ